jgi:hypothetical protein
MDIPSRTPSPAGPARGDHSVTTCLTSGGYSNITRTIPAGSSRTAGTVQDRRRMPGRCACPQPRQAAGVCPGCCTSLLCGHWPTSRPGEQRSQ